MIDKKTDDREIFKERIIWFLARRSYGREGREVSIGVIASELGIEETHATCPITRSLIKDILQERRCPIGSSGRGYFIITTEEERRKILKSLQSRILGIARRIKCLKECKIDEKLKQRRLFL